ncbi:hypothetical protein WEN_02685 [Mycoplasma wenyonii str. Massachusetts]|uniref:Uncharacterized protein n=1 Tax=Mycoplasma wenyonii (strain Massachusetts) TaxID=1197325 RepID=I6ZFE1_MYCWM|nr:hypothetical protein [Mycoplasma wenyonii]AFN65322.1 hypothetical protein WEN_02685 [Mycoplasma wenyonii str. Massachusetts]
MLLAKIAGGFGGVGIISLAGVTGAKSLISYPSREVFLIAESQSGNTKLFWEKRKGEAPLPEQPNTNFDLKVTHNGKEITGKFLFCFPKSDKNEYYLLRWGNGLNSSWRYNLFTVNEEGASIQCQEDTIQRMGEKWTKLSFKILPENGNNTTKEIDLKNCTSAQIDESTTLKMTCSSGIDNHKKVEITAQLTKI